MAKIKAFFYYIVELIMAIIVLGILNISLIKITLYNEEYIKQLFKDNKYYEYMDKEIKNEMINNIIPTQLPESVLDNIYTDKELEDEVNNIIHSIYSDNNIKIDATKVSERLKNNINKYISDNNIRVDNATALNKIVTQMSDIYIKKLSQSNIYRKIQKIVSKTNKYIDIGLIVCITSFILLYILSIILKKDYNLSLCLLTSGILELISITYFKINITINNIYIWDDSISKLIHIILNKIVNTASMISISFIVLSFLIILIKKNKKKVSSKR